VFNKLIRKFGLEIVKIDGFVVKQDRRINLSVQNLKIIRGKAQHVPTLRKFMTQFEVEMKKLLKQLEK
jgi:hypothetical protein